MAETTTTVRFYFDAIGTAAEALIVVLKDARVTKAFYTFGSLSAQQVLESGLVLSGETTAVAAKLEQLPGATRHDE